MKKWYGQKGKNWSLYISENVSDGLKKFFKKIDPIAREKGLIAFGLQLINNSVNGSPNEPARAPIREGKLRGSGSVFVGSKKVGDTTFMGKKGTPATSYTERNPNITTVGFNTKYAAFVHENLRPDGSWIPGGKDGKGAALSADVRGKFLERHLKSDRKELTKLFADTYRKFAGT